MDRQRIDGMVDKVIKEHGIDPSNGYDIVTLAKRMGFVVATASLDESEDGFIMVNNDGTNLLGTDSSKVIVINQSRDQKQKRFTIAHELGHYVINGKDKTIFAHRKKEGGMKADNENDVDYFAASLLMPKDAFTAKYKQYRQEGRDFSERVIDLMRTFRAPLKSVLRRMEELDLIVVEEIS